jgi:hypothetical protein
LFPIPFIVETLMRIDGVPSKGLLISATNAVELTLMLTFQSEGSTSLAMPALPSALIEQLSTLVAQYISGQRERYFPRAVRLSNQ